MEADIQPKILGRRKTLIRAAYALRPCFSITHLYSSEILTESNEETSHFNDKN